MYGSVENEIRKGAIEILDQKAEDAVIIMRNKAPAPGKNPFSHGALRDSIHKENTGEFSRAVGTSITGENGFCYARSVNDGRGSVFPKPGNPWGKVYLKGLDIWRPVAGPARAQHFVEDTANALK